MVTLDGVLAVVEAWRTQKADLGLGILPAAEIARRLGCHSATSSASAQALVEVLTAEVSGLLRELAIAGEISVSLDGLAVIA